MAGYILAFKEILTNMREPAIPLIINACRNTLHLIRY